MQTSLRCITITITICFMATALSCGGSPNESASGAFSMEIEVVYESGIPVSGLQVSAWNEIVPAQSNKSVRSLDVGASAADPGDINCNGLANEIADFVMFTNFLVIGEPAFNDHVDCSIDNGDVDGDGISLTIMDLVHIFGSVNGSPLPLPSQTSETVIAEYIHRHNEITIVNNLQISALFLQFGGEISPQILNSNFEISYAYDADSNSTAVLISPPLFTQVSEIPWFTGSIVHGGKELLEITGATPDGRPVVFTDVSFKPELSAPYPNPSLTEFTVQLAFRLPSDYTMKILNLDGKLQHFVKDSTESGAVGIRWHPNEMTNTAYRIELEARSNDTVYTLAPQFAVISTNNPADNEIGFTSASGTLGTAETWRFPSLFNLPILRRTDSFGNSLGNFSYSSSTTVVLMRPGTIQSESYQILLERGNNRFRLVWPY